MADLADVVQEQGAATKGLTAERFRICSPGWGVSDVAQGDRREPWGNGDEHKSREPVKWAIQTGLWFVFRWEIDFL